MAIDFPNSPTTNQTYAVGTKTWQYDGEKWLSLSNTPAAGLIAIDAKTGNYTAVLTDAGKLIEMGVGSANTFTVPPNGSVAFPVGTTIDIVQTSTGKTQIVAGSGVTVNSANGLYLRAQWSAVTVIKRATDTWVLFGDTSVS